MDASSPFKSRVCWLRTEQALSDFVQLSRLSACYKWYSAVGRYSFLPGTSATFMTFGLSNSIPLCGVNITPCLSLIAERPKVLGSVTLIELYVLLVPGMNHWLTKYLWSTRTSLFCMQRIDSNSSSKLATTKFRNGRCLYGRLTDAHLMHLLS